MGNHLFHIVIGRVGGHVRIGQNIPGVEDVEALVLHCPHVEIFHGHHVVQVKVVFPAIGFLVPPHGALECSHGELALVNIPVIGVEIQFHVTAAAGAEAVFQAGEIAGDDREQVGGFRKGIMPFGQVNAVVHFLPDEVAVAQEHGVQVRRAPQYHPVGSQVVRPVD